MFILAKDDLRAFILLYSFFIKCILIHFFFSFFFGGRPMVTNNTYVQMWILNPFTISLMQMYTIHWTYLDGDNTHTCGLYIWWWWWWRWWVKMEKEGSNSIWNCFRSQVLLQIRWLFLVYLGVGYKLVTMSSARPPSFFFILVIESARCTCTCVAYTFRIIMVGWD